mmetsp:Transcript_53161/g.151480  ORF Transcript_53161/g.151480 Transcript_53161/m.151480 type:complete len:322 (-) Transcript_53161:1150-2115(-)
MLADCPVLAVAIHVWTHELVVRMGAAILPVGMQASPPLAVVHDLEALPALPPYRELVPEVLAGGVPCHYLGLAPVVHGPHNVWQVLGSRCGRLCRLKDILDAGAQPDPVDLIGVALVCQHQLYLETDALAPLVSRVQAHCPVLAGAILIGPEELVGRMRARVLLAGVNGMIPIGVVKDLEALPVVAAESDGHLVAPCLAVVVHLVDGPVVPGPRDARPPHLVARWLNGLRLGDPRAQCRAACPAASSSSSASCVGVCPALLHNVLRDRLDRREVKGQRCRKVHLELLGDSVAELDAGQTVHAGVHQRRVVAHVAVVDADEL